MASRIGNRLASYWSAENMKASIFVFTRSLQTSNGVLRQAITILAEDEAAARQVLSDHLSTIRAHSRRPENAYQGEPHFAVQAVSIDRSKVITALVTH